MFKCRLKIKSQDKNQSTDKGLTIHELGEILLKLSACLEPEGFEFFLDTVEHSAYTPVVETATEAGVIKFGLIHNSIKLSEYSSLSSPEKEYADMLDKYLFKRGYFLTVTNGNSLPPIEINSIKKTITKTFNIITSVTGRIVSIIGKKEENPYIAIEATNEKFYPHVRITIDQEKELSKYYKDTNIRFRIRRHITTDEFKEEYSILIDYRIPLKRSFWTSIKETNNEYKDVFTDIQDSAKKIRELRDEYD